MTFKILLEINVSKSCLGAATWNARSLKVFLVIFLGIFHRHSFEDLRLFPLFLRAIRQNEVAGRQILKFILYLVHW